MYYIELLSKVKTSFVKVMIYLLGRFANFSLHVEVVMFIRNIMFEYDKIEANSLSDKNSFN